MYPFISVELIILAAMYLRTHTDVTRLVSRNSKMADRGIVNRTTHCTALLSPVQPVFEDDKPL